MIKERKVLGVGNAFLEIDCPIRLGAWRGAVSVIPGGGFRKLSLHKEGASIRNMPVGWTTVFISFSICKKHYFLEYEG